jgi:hypothetical protein
MFYRNIPVKERSIYDYSADSEIEKTPKEEAESEKHLDLFKKEKRSRRFEIESSEKVQPKQVLPSSPSLVRNHIVKQTIVLL